MLVGSGRLQMEFDNKISLGNVITIASVIVGLTVGYTTLQNQQVAQAERVTRIEQQVTAQTLSMANVNDQIDRRVRALEVMQASQTSDLRNIQVGINEIKQALERFTPRQ